MVFNSLTFIVFFACVLAMHSLPISWIAKKRNLLVASYLFYAAWNPPFIVLLWISTVVDWVAAQKMVQSDSPARRRAWMLISVVANLGMLAYFKYGPFAPDNFRVLMAANGIHHPAPAFHFRFPVSRLFRTIISGSKCCGV